MKKIFTTLLIAISLIPFSSRSQTPHPFELGFNGGASWLQSDVQMKKLGGGFGFTFGQMYCQTPTSPLDWGWRLRYLNANTFGQDSRRTTGLQNNNVLNGKIDSTLDYNTYPGFVYQNYKTHIDELSVELQLGLNRVREKTKVYPYIFGGLGFTKAVAKTDQLDAAGMRYDYFAIDSTLSLSSSEITSKLNDLYDGTYESVADGNSSASWKLMPSFGAGLGFQVAKGFSIGLEHKMTWTLNDIVDGQQWTPSNTSTGDNDRYHYSSIWLKFSFGRGSRSNSTTTSDANNYTGNGGVVNNNNNNTTTNNNTQNNNSGQTTTPEKPVVKFNKPSTGGATVTSPEYNVAATITNVNSNSDVTFTVNGTQVTSFTYNPSTDQFSSPVTLAPGTNTFMITASNGGGVTTANTSVNYSVPAPPAMPAPVVQVTSPGPANTSHPVATISGTIQNIAGRSDMAVSHNGTAINTFTYNAAAKTFSVTGNLVPGSNTFMISGYNAAGSDSKSTVIIFNDPSSYTPATPAPVVTITAPSAPSSSTNSPGQVISGTVQNVSGSGQISVTFNGAAIPFSYNASNRLLSFPVSLISGANTVIVTATNAGGTDSEQRTIIYSPLSEPKPLITITNPAANPSNATSSPAVINATVMNVTGKGQLSATVNGSNVMTSALTFDPSTHQLSFPANLVAGSNNIQISATNIAGSDSKSTTILYSPQASAPAPTVTITTPSVNPFNTASPMTSVHATVMNVASQSEITVLLNGAITPFIYNAATKKLSFNASLIPGANTVTITAANAGGSASASTTIISTVAPATPAPVVTFTSPVTNPHVNTTANASVVATVQNVGSSSQISATLNGNPVAFNFNAATKKVNFNAPLIAGANTVVISATNSGGSDSKTTTIIYNQPATVAAPVVTITSPATSPMTTTTSIAVVNATVLNVNTSAEIAVKVNGTSTPFSFNASTHQVTLSTMLINGSNVIVISATNAGGSDSKTATIVYNAPSVVPAPVVTITSPTANPFNTTANTVAITATVINVAAASDITVSLNGANTTFNYNSATKILSLNPVLIAGANSIAISASNSAGSDSKATTVIYTAPAPMAPPVVTITSPAANPHQVSANTFTVKAQVLNVTGASQIKVYQNNLPKTAFSYVVATKQLSFPATLNPGANWFKIVATNSAGKDSAVVTIKMIQTSSGTTADSAGTGNPGRPGKGIIGGMVTGSEGGSTGPEITLVTPATTTAITSDAMYTISAKTDVPNASSITVTINGVAFPAFSYNKVTKAITIPFTPVNGNNTVVITATGSGGTSTKTLTITKQ